MTAWNDFNDADAQQSGFDLIPKGSGSAVRTNRQASRRSLPRR